MSSIRNFDLYRIFNKLDKNGDGLVSLEELKWLLDSIGVPASLEELKSLVAKNNLDPIDFVLFHDVIINKGNNCDKINDDEERRAEIEEEEDGEGDEMMIRWEKDLRKAFEVFDSNGDGFISSEKLKSALCILGLWDEGYLGTGGDYCNCLFSVYDTNSDGKIDFEEFKKMMSV